MDGVRRFVGARLAAVLLSAGLAAGLATAASAQDPSPVPDNPTDGVLTPKQQATLDKAQNDPGEACQEQVNDNGLAPTTNGAGCDNRYTPIAKDGSKMAWTQFAGAVYGGASRGDGGYDPTNTISKVPVTVDFYTVSFANPSRGFAGGAQCRREPVDGTTGAALTKFLDECERVPVIYRYSEDGPNGPIWEPAYKGNTPGYVGAISWLHNLDTKEHGQRVLAVGGDSSPSESCPKTQTGCPGYPRREPAVPDDLQNPEDTNCTEGSVKSPEAGTPSVTVDPGKPPTVNPINIGTPPSAGADPAVTAHDPEEELTKCEDAWRQANDPAGKGRAWLYTDGDWQERDVPREMRGMTALDAALDTGNCPGATSECAMAGGLQQIWMWRDNDFDTTPWRPDSGPGSPSKPVSSPPKPAAYLGNSALTRCSTGWSCQWHFRVRAIRFAPGQAGGAFAVTSGCCSASPAPEMRGGRVLEYTRGSGTWSVGRVASPSLCSGISLRTCGPGNLADSLYALTFGVTGATGQTARWSYLATPGGPERSPEAPSQVVSTSQQLGGDTTVGGHAATSAKRHWMTSARLVAGDGDLQPHQVALHERLTVLGNPDGPDGLMDWAVGGAKQSQQAVAYTTTTQAYSPVGADAPFPLECPPGLFPGTDHNVAPQCKPKDPAKTAEQSKSGYLFRLSSYFLNDFAFAGSSSIGWAVGDRGAIERLAGNEGDAGGTLREERQPSLGAKRQAPPPPREPYEEHEPKLSEQVGEVPPLSSQQSKPSAPRLTPYGSPDPHGGGVTQMAMSRDGSEGWTIGAGTTLYRFDGTRWRACSTDSVEGVLRADPACEALWPLRHDKGGVALTAIARVPMEYGEDPTKANEFEAVAAARNGKILRYRDGRWGVDQEATNQINVGSGGVTDIAFSAPDDGWLVGIGSGDRYIYHFDGERWTQCAGLLGRSKEWKPRVDASGCADHNALIPTYDAGVAPGFHVATSGQRLYLYTNRTSGSETARPTYYPLVLYKDPGPCEKRGDPGCWQQGYDPGCAQQIIDPDDPSKTTCVAANDRSKIGVLYSLSVALGPDGSYNGWGLGQFQADPTTVRLRPGAKETALLRSDATGKHWQPTPGGGAADDYLLAETTQSGPGTVGSHQSGTGGVSSASQIVALPAIEGNGAVLANPGTGNPDVPTVWLDPARGHWRLLPTPYMQLWGRSGDVEVTAATQAMAPDSTGGLWLVASARSGENESIFYRFSGETRPELFKERPHPIRERITAAAGGGDASFWLATNTEAVYRYDRLTGWDRMTIPGWDPGRVRTVSSPANAIAIGPDGTGIVVGKNGRIANIGPGGAVLDAAAGILCSKQGPEPPYVPPCASGRDLLAAAIAPDGSALAGGDARALLWRPAGEQFRAITPPPTAVFAKITGVSMPRPDRAWLTTESGEIYGGELNEQGTDWSWRREDTDAFGDSISRDRGRRQRPLRAIAIDASGHGYAVGDQGTIIERTGEGKPPWKRIDAGYLDHMRAVTLGPDGKGALIGGDGGLILTLDHGRFEPARFARRFDPTVWGSGILISRIAGLALLPGHRDGQVEAWAASQAMAVSNPNRNSPPAALYHYSSDPSEPLLDGSGGRAEGLGDTAPASANELSFAAFGNSGCQFRDGKDRTCAEIYGSNEAHERVVTQLRAEIIAARDRSGGPAFSLFTGDVGEGPGTRQGRLFGTHHEDTVVLDRWAEMVADPLSDAGIPTFGAIGGRDLLIAEGCAEPVLPNTCYSTRRTRSGQNLGWRQSMAGMPEPWGFADPASSHQGLSFEPIDTGGTKLELGDLSVEDPTKKLGGETVRDPTKELPDEPIQDPTDSETCRSSTVGSVASGAFCGYLGPQNPHGAIGDHKVPEEGEVGDQTLPTGGAHTHYALDVKRDGKALLRLVVLDTSLKSLAAADPVQNPTEEQLGWLQDALKRPAGQRAVVLTNTPTYSYGPGANGETVTEGTVLESILMQNKVDLVVDGRLGWNALYYALAPGVHWPCPGSSYPDRSPPSVPSCGPAGSSEAEKAAGDAQKSVAEITGNDTSRKLPFLISHTAGGKFGPEGESDGPAANGFWRGYSIVHLDPESGDIQIEQRPVFDWIGIRVPPGQGKTATHVLRPRQKLELEGFGREPLGIDVGPRYDEITSAAITHCYDLVYADPEKPWLPLKAEDATDEQLAAQGVGCPNRERAGAQLSAAQSGGEGSSAGPCESYVCLPSNIGSIEQNGQVRAGSGEQERTFGMAILSVGEKVATYPVTFEPRPSFAPPRIPPPPPPPPAAPPAPPANPPVGTVGNLSLPTPPALPNLPLSAELVPPAPPIPPPPPGAASVAPLNLFLSTPGINIAPQSTVVPPPAPPIQPAPPGGARKEARQRQAAAQKSGSESGNDAQELGGDLADGPPEPKGTAMTRIDHSFSQRRPDTAAPSFTTMADRGQPSAWARNLQWGGGMTLMALVLAFGWITVRPTPRQRPPHVPAPAWSRTDYRRRRR